MAALCRSYPTHGEALEAVNAALGAGVSGEDVLVLTGERQRDAHQEQVGEFAGTTDFFGVFVPYMPAPSPEASIEAEASPTPTATS